MKRIYSVYMSFPKDDKNAGERVFIGLVDRHENISLIAETFLMLHADEVSPHPFNTTIISPFQTSLLNATVSGQTLEVPVAAALWQPKTKTWKQDIFEVHVVPADVLDSPLEIKKAITGV